MKAQQFPLTWPPNFARWKASRTSGAFRTDFDSALKNVRKSLEAFAKDSGKTIHDQVLSSNIDMNPLTSDRGKRPADPGVAVWFTWDGIPICIPVDRYDTPAHNLQAIHHIIEARRTELRHGTLTLVRATFTGFKALPPPPGKSWRELLELPDGRPNKAQIESAHRRLLLQHHPDRGGSHERMAEINEARDNALKEVT